MRIHHDSNKSYSCLFFIFSVDILAVQITVQLAVELAVQQAVQPSSASPAWSQNIRVSIDPGSAQSVARAVE